MTWTVTCPRCNGTGVEPEGEIEECLCCTGAGAIDDPTPRQPAEREAAE